MRYAFKVQYIGKNYSGSQLQPDKPSVQEELEKALCTLIIGGNTEYNRQVKAVFSGRTDKGVNSVGQVVHFDVDKPIVASKFIYSLNEILPDDISVSDLEKVDLKFHAQKSAKRRHYEYVFVNRKCKNAFDGDLLRVKYDIDIDRMQKALDYIKGEHDFSSFKSSGTLNPSKICFIYEAKVERVGDRVHINIIGNRFLYNMVRAIVGTLLEIEGHNLQASYMKGVLDAKDRKKAGRNVSPYGLTLMKVEY
ncbi:MAG: tRNA pseudouridine(38-40) synthase TruA [Cyanobacteria bacterium SIG32]|nr:tRNA pseudouridine(38-40) synthase TruA [Cyanobacteria bacterium SIG32]